MLKRYIKQALYDIKENKLISFISIAGTALAISMIMINVTVERIDVVPFVPEVNRDRTLYVPFMSARYSAGEGTNNGMMSLRTAKECFKRLTLPEVVTLYTLNQSMLLTVPGSKNINGSVKQTDDDFWRLFRFHFIRGVAYDNAVSDAGLPQAVVTEKIANRLFGTVEVIGEKFMINRIEYTITGVVKEVSYLARAAYAEVWIPYNSTDISSQAWFYDIMGSFQVAILARNKKDFSRILEECEKFRQQYNASLGEYEVNYTGQPHTQEVFAKRELSDKMPDIKKIRKDHLMVLLVLLLVPAANLCAMSVSRMSTRMDEIAIHRTFGAGKGRLFTQVFCENMVITLIGGVIGLLLCFISLKLFNRTIFSFRGYSDLSFDMLFTPVVFMIAFLFCLIINLLCTILPAWKVIRSDIVKSLKK